MCEKHHVTVFCNLVDEKRNLFHACQKLRFLRRIDVCIITISRFPAAEVHLSCSSAAGRHPFKHLFGDCLCEPEPGFLPPRRLDGTKQMHYASDRAGKRTPRIRLCGRSAHEASVRTARMRGVQKRVPGSSRPRTTPDAIAPVYTKKAPADAHSLSRGKQGTSKVMPAGSFHTPRIGCKYTG